MALLRDFEIPGTGVVVNDAYHVITNVRTEKRLQDITPPPDDSREDGLTVGDLGPEVYWKAGYIGSIEVTVFASSEARSNGKNYLGMFGDTVHDFIPDGIVTKGQSYEIKFFVDPESSDSVLTQAYNHLKSTEYYSEAQEV